jgi:hypothetical protein
VALVAYQHLLSRGFRIPDDIGILGFDDMVGIGSLFLPPLSTIRLPHDDIGRAAAFAHHPGAKEVEYLSDSMPFSRQGILLVNSLFHFRACNATKSVLLRICYTVSDPG